jgi:hypothetical protein
MPEKAGSSEGWVRLLHEEKKQSRNTKKKKRRGETLKRLPFSLIKSYYIISSYTMPLQIFRSERLASAAWAVILKQKKKIIPEFRVQVVQEPKKGEAAMLL